MEKRVTHSQGHVIFCVWVKYEETWCIVLYRREEGVCVCVCVCVDGCVHSQWHGNKIELCMKAIPDCEAKAYVCMHTYVICTFISTSISCMSTQTNTYDFFTFKWCNVYVYLHQHTMHVYSNKHIRLFLHSRGVICTCIYTSIPCMSTQNKHWAFVHLRADGEA